MSESIFESDAAPTSDFQLPKKKKLRKLVKKETRPAEQLEDAIFYGDESSDDNNANNKVEIFHDDEDNYDNDDDANKFHAPAPVTYQSKLDELSAQIAEMDAENENGETKIKKLKRSRKPVKRVSNAAAAADLGDEQNNGQEGDAVVPRKVKQSRASKSGASTIEGASSVPVERNEDLLRRLADKFDDEETDENIPAQNEADDEEYEDDYAAKKTTGKAGAKAGKSKDSSKSTGGGAIKNKNKLFGHNEISVTQSSDNILSSEFPAIEEECLQDESICFEQRQGAARNAKNLFGFLQQSILYKKQRGLDFEQSQTKLKDDIQKSQETQEIVITDSNASGDKGETDEMNSGTTLKQQPSLTLSQSASSTSNGQTSELKKLQMLKRNSMQMQKLVSDSQISLKSDGSDSQRGFASMHDELDIELEVPNVDKRVIQKQDSLINNTLFFNKIMRTDSTVLSSLTRQSSNSTSSVLSNSKLSANMPQLQKKAVSRQAYLQEGQRRITERKSQSLNFQEVHNRFKHTTLENLLVKAGKKAEEDVQELETTAEGEKEGLKKEKSASEQSQENKMNNGEGNEEAGILEEEDNEVQEVQEEEQEEDEDDEDDEEKQEQMIQAEIQYRKLLALEEGMSEKDIERMIREEYGLGDASDEEGDDDDDDEEEEDNNKDGEIDLFNVKKQTESSIYGDFQDATEVQVEAGDEETDGGGAKPLKRLKKIAGEILKKRKEKEDQRRLKEERRSRRKALLANPIMKKLMGDMIEDEAEQGSDNEENDDKVHANLDEEAEHRQAGLDKEEDLDAELAELINNQVTINDEDEQMAASKFLRDLARQDKEELKKIISGSYKSHRAKKRNLADLLDENDGSSAAGAEAKKLKRIQDAILTLQSQTEEGQYASEEEDVNGNNGGDRKSGLKKKGKKGGSSGDTANDEESELIQIREANLLLKKEYQKVSGMQAFDEKKLVDSSLLALMGNSKNAQAFGQQVMRTAQSTMNSNASVGATAAAAAAAVTGTTATTTTMKRIIPKKVNESEVQNNAKNVFGFKQAVANAKNSVLHVKQNKHRLSQFNESFNKDSMINEFGESALQKAFTNFADHSQSIFYSNNNQENSNGAGNNSNGFKEKKEQASKNNGGNNSTASNKQKNMQTSSLNRLFQSSSVIASQPSANSFMIFGRKKN